MTLLEKLYLWNIAKGMLITFTHIFKKKATIKYPEQKRPFSKYSVACKFSTAMKKDVNVAPPAVLCAVACPAEAITMEAAERQPGEEHLYREEKYAAKYEINMLRCIFCGFCEEACPKDAIYLIANICAVQLWKEGIYL